MRDSFRAESACVIGLGKLGAPLAACMAARGVTVIGVDADQRKVNAINSGQPPVAEPGLAELLANCGGRLTAVGEIGPAVARRTSPSSWSRLPASRAAAFR